MKINRVNSQSGFTIIELMIATSVLSILLLMTTVIIIGIGNLYNKGVNQANVQDNVRTITDDLAQQLRFGDTFQNPNGTILENNQPVGVMCVDQTRYTYALGVQINTSLNHILWRDTLITGQPCVQADLTAPDPSVSSGGVAGSGSELINPGSRLTQFSSTSLSPYTINVGVAFGDPTLSPPAQGTTSTCLGSTGDQFCSTAYLTATVEKRSFE
jgi:prepilin-type N-terminal cleavage/methylation domain-containing protein